MHRVTVIASMTTIIGIFTAICAAYPLHQPKLCPNTSWNPNATTFATSSTIGFFLLGFFFHRNNRIFAANSNTNLIVMWPNTSTNPINLTTITPIRNVGSLFVTDDENRIFIYHNQSSRRIDQRQITNGSLISTISVTSECFSLAVDSDETVYCSQSYLHRVDAYSLRNGSYSIVNRFGTGCPGSTALMLNLPVGILVTPSKDLYVADCRNSRVQFFPNGQIDGITIVGIGSNQTVSLLCPTGVALDSDGNLFVVDRTLHQIIGSDAQGFRCVAGCTGSNGSASYELANPMNMYFAANGDFFVSDYSNHRIQKFQRLTSNTCSKSTMSLLYWNADNRDLDLI